MYLQQEAEGRENRGQEVVNVFRDGNHPHFHSGRRRMVCVAAKSARLSSLRVSGHERIRDRRRMLWEPGDIPRLWLQGF